MGFCMIFKPADYSFPNLIIEGGWTDDETRQINYRLTPSEGYVFYDSTANNTDFDPETDEEIPVTYYYTLAYLPLNYNFNNFPYVAVLRSSVDENYIFGSDDKPEHEIM